MGLTELCNVSVCVSHVSLCTSPHASVAQSIVLIDVFVGSVANTLREDLEGGRAWSEQVRAGIGNVVKEGYGAECWASLHTRGSLERRSGCS